MWPILFLMLACETRTEPPAAPPGETPRERAAALRAQVQEAQNDWSAGQRKVASRKVLGAYAGEFEPMEPLLRGVDATAVLQLEYDFGRLARMLSKKGQPVRVNDAVQDVLGRVDSLVAELPHDPLVVAPPEPEVVKPVAVEIAPPKTELTTYGEAAKD